MKELLLMLLAAFLALGVYLMLRRYVVSVSVEHDEDLFFSKGKVHQAHLSPAERIQVLAIFHRAKMREDHDATATDPVRHASQAPTGADHAGATA